MKLTFVILLGFFNIDSCKIINKKDVFYQLECNNILYPDVVLSQSILETGNFKSKICLNNNNLFGMRLPKKRKTTAIGVKYNYSIYSSWYDSIIDYKIWQDNIPKHYLISKEKYLEFLSKKYSKTDNYVKLIKNIMKHNIYNKQ